MKKLTTEEFIKSTLQVHGNTYDYSEVAFVAIIQKLKEYVKNNQVITLMVMVVSYVVMNVMVKGIHII